MSERLPSSAEGHNQEPAASFLDFLLVQPQLQEANPVNTKLYFDLDETILKRVAATSETITGTWRTDMPQTISELKKRGFSIGILSSAQQGYIRAALEIYGQQFSTDPAVLFEDQLSTHSFARFGDKQIAFPEVASIAAIGGKRVIFVDDAPPEFGQEAGFGIVQVPKANQYQDRPSTTFEAVWV